MGKSHNLLWLGVAFPAIKGTTLTMVIKREAFVNSTFIHSPHNAKQVYILHLEQLINIPIDGRSTHWQQLYAMLPLPYLP
jgi:hypothetical protein